MAANFQPQMNNGGQMMMQQQQRGQQPQQRPQQPNQSMVSGQIQQEIFRSLQDNTGPLEGWQANVMIQERISMVFNLVGNLRLASQSQQNGPTINKMIEIGLKFEKEIFERSPDKEHYKHEIQMKLDQLLERRNQNMQGLQQSINEQARAQQAAAQQQMMNQNGMQGQMTRPQPAQQGFHHLQQQMTASPIPGQVNQQPGGGMPNQGMPPNMTPNQQQQFQMSMQQQGQQNLQNGLGRPQNGQPPNMQQSQQEAMVTQLGHKLMAQASEQERNQMRVNLQTGMDATVLQGYAAKGIDPLFLYYRNQALQRLGAQRRQQQQQQAQQAQQAQAQAQSLITQQQAQNIPATAPPMQQQRSTNRSPMNGQTQPPTSTGGNADFFVGNMIDQQQQGVMAEQAGQTVVPMSNAQRNATPQPGLMAGQPLNMNDQRAVSNPNITAQQRQQLFNAQQQRVQQQQAAQAQQQQTARANNQAKAQQMALQGQIGGMGPGPMPPQQSPAMATLNAPLTRTPGQMNQPDAAQVNPNVQFGQPLDPRFSQGNQRAQMNAAIISTMPQEMQNKLASFPPERVNELVMQWHQRQRQQQNGQPGRPQIPMQANNQMRPGPQVPQEGQFNSQNPLSQFMMANPGRPPPAQLMNGMNPQQQMLLQQQIGRMHPNHLQQRNANGIPMNPQAAQHMDQMDIPQQALAHPTMPRSIPQEIKKWGALKSWVQQSGGLAPDSLTNVITLQKAHYNQQLRARNANRMAAGGMPAGGPGAAAILPPGIAPMANMGNQIQMPGMNIPQSGVPQVTAQDIQSARLSAPQLANASDDQIRAQIMRNRFNNHQQQQQRQNHLMQQQQLQMAQMAQMNNQQPRPGIPGQMQQPGGQNVPGQMQQPNKPPQALDSVPPVANRANRPTPVSRGNPPNSSPAEPVKNNLKRQNSEDVVEVPNPNSMGQRSTPQQNLGLKAPSQGATPQPPRPQHLSPEQIQKLDVEARKRYEHGIRMYQQSQQNTNSASSLIVKLRQIASEENARGQSSPMPDLPMNAATKASIQASLPMVVKPLKGMTQAIGKWYEATHDDARARNFFRMSYRIRKQYHDEGQYQQMKENFSITPAEIEGARRVLVTMIGDLSNMMPGKMKRPDAPQPDSATASAPTPPQAGPASTIPLNAANLQQQQKQLMNHQRAPSRGSNAPAAPTSTQPPFPFGGASPHGTPAYGNGKQSVTQADLKIPPRKKPKTGNNPSAELGTPGSMASPSVNKTVSPEIRRQVIVDTKQQPVKPMLCCSEPDCDRHKTGFENEEALKAHREEEHIKPLSNPLKYAQENLAAVLGLDPEGHQKSSLMGEKMVQSESRQGQTPTIKAGTPMSRQDSMIRQGSSTGKSSTKPQIEAAKLAATSQPTVIADSWANATIDPQELFAAFQGFETGAGGTISDLTVYRSITPNESPESNSTAVTDTSDISDGVNLDINLELNFDESWMPFGGSDINGLADLNNFDFGNEDMPIPLEDDQPMANYMSWDDMQQEFNKPFEFDTSMYLMNPGQ